MKLLGIDVGTGGTRAVIIDERGKVVSSATADHLPFASPQIGWAEQDPRDWWRASIEAVRAALANGPINPGDISGVGFSGQMHGAVLLDKEGQVLRPALIWCDQRTDAQCKWITDKIGPDRLIELTCNPALTGFTLPKLLWVRDNEPDLWSEARHVLLPKDYVRYRLTGDRATDVADASGMLLFDVARRKWSSEVAAAAGIPETMLPAAYESPEVTGCISTEAAELTGLRGGTPVVAGGGDQAAGAVGMGIVSAGAVSATIGTSGVVFAAADRPAIDSAGRVHTFCHAVPGRWHVMGVTQAAGLSLRWFRDTFGTLIPAGEVNAAGSDPYDRLCQEAAASPAGSEGVLWAPYLMGERTPHLDPHARAALVGLAASHTRSHIIRAILEGVAFSLRDSFEIFREMDVPVESVRLGGGGARAPLWRQIQADIYGRPVGVLEAEEGAAFGAALLAGVGAGAWPSVDAACARAVRVASQTEPDPASASLLNRQYAAYRALYPALRVVLERLR
jgi:xylulokinase